MRMQVLVAGCSKDEKESVTALLREILKSRPGHESWTASIVKATGGWAVTLDGPDQRLRGVTFRAPADGLRSAIVEVLQRAGFLPGAPVPQASTSVASAGRAPAAAPGEVRDRHTCSSCGKPFVVIYMASPDEPSEAAPVACPNCWKVLRVLVPAEAGETREYRADKLPE
jgi:DNA-directed RNA polymerase subunit RPC12/RpoP